MSTENTHFSTMVLLAGEQPAPNLLAARHFNPKKVLILHTDFPKSKLMAERLALRLGEMDPELKQIAAYRPGEITTQISSLLQGKSNIIVNVTGGTKPMSFGALQAARENRATPIYVRSQKSKTEIDVYDFLENGTPFVSNTIHLQDTITLEDYLVSYFGNEYRITGIGGESLGRAFEEAIQDALKPWVDDIEMGWKDSSGSVDVDAVIRCNNQIGIIEIKTGKAARKMDGIKQLSVSGGQRFFGTYVKRFLIVSQSWEDNYELKELADALNITVIEFPNFEDRGVLTSEEKEALGKQICSIMGK